MIKPLQQNDQYLLQKGDFNIGRKLFFKEKEISVNSRNLINLVEDGSIHNTRVYLKGAIKDAITKQF